MTHFVKGNCLLIINECAKVTKEQYFDDNLLSVKYNKTCTLKTLPLVCMKVHREYHDKYSTQLCLVLYLPLDSHLKLYISLIQTGGSASSNTYIYSYSNSEV